MTVQVIVADSAERFSDSRQIQICASPARKRPVALSCVALNLAARVSPPARFACVRSAHRTAVACPAIFPDFIPLFATVAWRSAKYEDVYLKAYESVSQARQSIAAYRMWYHRQRPHSSLADRTPYEVYFALLPAIETAAKRPALSTLNSGTTVRTNEATSDHLPDVRIPIIGDWCSPTRSLHRRDRSVPHEAYTD